MSKKKADNTLGIAFLLVHLGLFASIGLMIKSDQFPVAWRYSMFLNAPNSLVIASLMLAVILVAPLHILLTRTAKRLKDSKINPVIYYVDFAAIFSLVFIFTQLGLIINGTFDKSSPETYTVKVTEKDVKSSLRRHGYYIYCEDWLDSTRDVQISVNPSRYKTVEVGDTIQVVTKQGFLGYEWIVNRRQIMNGTQ